MLYRIGSWNSGLTLAQARLTAANKDKSRTVVYVGDQYGNWARSTARSIRPLSSVILEEGVEEKLVRDAKDFLRSAKWYSDRGIPYRRGYLLHGTAVRPRSRAVVCVRACVRRVCVRVRRVCVCVCVCGVTPAHHHRQTRLW